MFAEAYEKRDVLKTCSAQCATHGSGLIVLLVCRRRSRRDPRCDRARAGQAVLLL